MNIESCVNNCQPLIQLGINLRRILFLWQKNKTESRSKGASTTLPNNTLVRLNDNNLANLALRLTYWILTNCNCSLSFYGLLISVFIIDLLNIKVKFINVFVKIRQNKTNIDIVFIKIGG